MRRLIFPALLLAALWAGAGPSAAAPPGAPEEDAPVVVPSRLAGLDGTGVRRALGEPALARGEGAGAVWTYRLPRCALFVYFADEGKGLRVTGVSSGPRRHGEVAPEPEACLAEAPPPASAAEGVRP